MSRSLPIRHLAASLLAATLLGAPSPVAGQLRPLDPMDWREVGMEGRVVTVGGGMLWGQRASLAGTEGLLLELGSFRAVWGLGRVSLELGGTALWYFEERSTFAEPAEDVVPARNARRIDAGDYKVTTLVALTPHGAARGLALRFGARLPTTDNQQGLDRDQTDFFALVLGGTGDERRGVSAELGVGVFGTRDTRNEQVDVLLFGLSARHGFGAGEALLELAGQHDTRAGPEWRGNENLGEARLGYRAGGDRWIHVALVRGWTPHSPDLGVTVQFGRRF